MNYILAANHVEPEKKELATYSFNFYYCDLVYPGFIRLIDKDGSIDGVVSVDGIYYAIFGNIKDKDILEIRIKSNLKEFNSRESFIFKFYSTMYERGISFPEHESSNLNNIDLAENQGDITLKSNIYKCNDGLSKFIIREYRSENVATIINTCAEKQKIKKFN